MTALALRLRCSKLERLWLGAGHSLAALAVGLSAVPMWTKLLLGAMLLASAYTLWRRAGQPKYCAIDYDGERWRLIGTDTQHAELLASTWRTRWLTLLHFRLEDGRFVAVPVWRDSLSQDDWRRLQVVLRWQVRLKR